MVESGSGSGFEVVGVSDGEAAEGGGDGGRGGGDIDHFMLGFCDAIETRIG